MSTPAELIRLGAFPVLSGGGVSFFSRCAAAPHSVANEVHKLRERAQQLEGAGVPYEPLPESLQRIMEDLDYQI